MLRALVVLGSLFVSQFVFSVPTWEDIQTFFNFSNVAEESEREHLERNVQYW